MSSSCACDNFSSKEDVFCSSEFSLLANWSALRLWDSLMSRYVWAVSWNCGKNKNEDKLTTERRQTYLSRDIAQDFRGFLFCRSYIRRTDDESDLSPRSALLPQHRASIYNGKTGQWTWIRSYIGDMQWNFEVIVLLHKWILSYWDIQWNFEVLHKKFGKEKFWVNLHKKMRKNFRKFKNILYKLAKYDQ